MKAVLISIRPEWCEKIVSGQKTIEVRKTRPKIETPFKCYIYCTANDIHRALVVGGGTAKQIICFNYKTAIPVGGTIGNGKVIGEFTCDQIYRYSAAFARGKAHEEGMTITDAEMERQSCLTQDELYRYENSDNNHRWGLLGWRISDLLIYDKPKKLNEFIRPGSLRGEELDDHICLYCDLGDKRLDNSCEKTKCSEAYIEYLAYENFVIDRPPQSWCYVEE